MSNQSESGTNGRFRAPSGTNVAPSGHPPFPSLDVLSNALIADELRRIAIRVQRPRRPDSDRPDQIAEDSFAVTMALRRLATELETGHG